MKTSRRRALFLGALLLSLSAAMVIVMSFDDKWLGRLRFESRLPKTEFYVGEPLVANIDLA